MQTFRELLSNPKHTLGPSAGPLTAPSASEIPVSGRKKLRLPKSLDAYGDVRTEHAEGFPEAQAGLLPTARIRLLAEPHVAFEGQSPTDDHVIALGGNAERVKSLGARKVVLANVVSIDGETLYGQAEAIYLSNGMGFGSSQLLFYRDRWTTDLAQLAVWLAHDLESSVSVLDIRPESNSPHWKKAALLLGGGSSEKLPAAWKRVMEVVGGLYCVDLDIRPNPDSARARIVGELKRSPPDALLVWSRWVADSHVYMETYRRARPDGIADLLGQHPETQLDFYEDVYELALHLATISPALCDGSTSARDVTSWHEAETRILSLECASFRLTARARECLSANPYPDPNRMLSHVVRLARLASDYAAAQGRIGDRLASVAKASYEIEIALTDDSLSVSSIPGIKGNSLNPMPHVKVDDFKSPDKCGRIYFALDHDSLQFVVDHIGLHDYG